MVRAEREKIVAQKNEYAAKMLLVRLDHENKNMNRLRSALVDTENSPNRGCEWYYWWRVSQMDLMTTHASDGSCFSVILGLI